MYFRVDSSAIASVSAVGFTAKVGVVSVATQFDFLARWRFVPGTAPSAAAAASAWYGSLCAEASDLGLATALTNLGAVLELAALGAIVLLLHCRGNTHIKYCGAGQREAKNLARTLDLVAVMLDVSGELNCCCCCCCCRLPTATVRASDSQMWL